MKKKIPNPGSRAAIKLGCTCPVLDNNYGVGKDFLGKDAFWINSGCPLHDVDSAVMREQLKEETIKIPPYKWHCGTCGREINTDKGEKLWCDDTTGLAISHGFYQCKECYSKNHNFCTKCDEQPLLPEWKACPMCGTKVKK